MSDWRISEPPAGATPLAPESIRETTPNIPPVVIEGAITIDEPKTPDDSTFKGLPVRVAGDKIWLLKEGKRQWITSADMYAKLGFKFGDERDIDAVTLMCIPEGLPLR